MAKHTHNWTEWFKCDCRYSAKWRECNVCGIQRHKYKLSPRHVLNPLKSLSPEELKKVPKLTKKQMQDALDQGLKDAQSWHPLLRRK